MDIDTPYTSADNTVGNPMVSIMSDIGMIPSLDKTKPITRKARPTVRKQQRSRLVLRRAVARLACNAKRTNPNLTIRITNTMDFDMMDLEEMNLEDRDSIWQLPPASCISHQHQQRHPVASPFIVRNQLVDMPVVADRWNNQDENDHYQVEDPNYM